MSVNPYTGLYLNTPNHPASMCTKTTANYDFLLDQMPLNRLTLNWESRKETKSRCPAVKFISKVLVRRAATLEELVFQQLPQDRTPFQNIKPELLPSLKIVRFPELSGCEHVPPVGLASFFIERAPALQVLDLQFCALTLHCLQLQDVPRKNYM